MAFGSVALGAALISAAMATVEGFLGGSSRRTMTAVGNVDARKSSPSSSSSFERRTSLSLSTASSSASSSSTSNAAARASDDDDAAAAAAAAAADADDADDDDDDDDDGGVLGIIFDIDGTLADSWNLGYQATLTVLAGYHNERCDDGDGDCDGEGASTTTRHTPETYPLTSEEYHFGCRYTTPERLARHVGLEPGHPSFVAVGGDLGGKFDEYDVRLVDRSTAGFYGGIGDLLVKLHRGDESRSGAGGGGCGGGATTAGVKLGALTNACVEYAHAVLKANCPQCSSDHPRAGDEDDGIYRRFSSIHGANSVPRPKPHGDGILLCCEEMGLHPSRVIYVGDAPTDARAAVDARCRAAIGVLWGSNDEECLGKEAGFDELCGNVEELATAIGRYL